MNFTIDKVTFCLDPGSLQSVLAISPTRKLGLETGCEFDILPVNHPLHRLVARDAQSNDDARADYRSRRALAREGYARIEWTRDCERLGLTPGLTARHVDGAAAGVGLLWLRKERSDEAVLWEFIRRVAHAGFVDGAPVHEDSFIHGLLDEPGGFLDYCSDEGRSALASLQDDLLSEGIFTDPAYHCRGELFHGRQHLPRIAWLLQGGDTGVPGQGPPSPF